MTRFAKFLAMLFFLMTTQAYAYGPPTAGCATDGSQAQVYNISINAWICVNVTGGGGGSITSILPTTGQTTVTNGTGPAVTIGLAATVTQAENFTGGLQSGGINVLTSVPATSLINLGTATTATNPMRTSEATTGFYSLNPSEVDLALGGTNVVKWTAVGEGVFGESITNSTGANALSVGANGATNPVLNVDASTASVATGINIKGAAAAGGVAVSVVSSGTNEALSINSKGSGTVNIETASTGTINIGNSGSGQIAINSGSSFTVGNSNSGVITLQSNAGNGFNIKGGTSTLVNFANSSSQFLFTPLVSTTAANARFLVTPAADLTLTASTSAPIFNFGGASAVTRQHATGTLAEQDDTTFQGTSDSFVAASTETLGNTVAIKQKNCGTNGTCASLTALYIPTFAYTGTVTNGYGINVNAPTAATNNYAAIFNGGNVGVGTTAPVASIDDSANTDALALPSGTTAQRPSSPINGEIRYNSDQVGSVEGYVNGGWTTFVNYDGTNNKNINVQNAPYWASGYLAQTTTNGSNSSGQLVINVNSTKGFNTNQVAIIYQGGSSQSPGHKNFACTIASIVANTSITCSGTAITGNGLPTYAPSSSGTTLITTVPASYMVFSVGTTTMSSASNGATSITLGNATGYLVNQGLMIYGGAASGANLITQITAVAGNVLTISPGISNASGVASGTYVQHDDTAAIQAAVNVASYNQNVDISVPDGYYQINGAPSGTGLNQVNLPNLNYFIGCCGTPASTAWWPQATINMHGFTPATQNEGYLAGINLAPMTGAIFESQDTTAGASMIGAYSSASLANMTNVQLVVKNMIFRSYPNPQSTMLNGNFVQEMSVYNSSFDTGETSQTTQPTTNSNNSAIIGPGGDNGGNNVFSQLEIYGYYWGVQSGEHTRLEHIRFDNDFFPWLINTSTGPQSANYGTTCDDLQFNGDTHGVASFGGAGTNIDCSLVNIEHATSPAWVTNVDDINDSSNLLYGFISIDSPLNGNTQTVTGGANLHIVNARSPAYPLGSSTFAALPTGVPNGTTQWCTNCTSTPTCAGSGNGAIATMINSVWSCTNGNGAFSSSTNTPLVGSGGTPTCGAGCSAITSGSTDARGSMTSGTLATTVVANFSTTLAAAPFCTCSGSSTTASAACTSSTTAVTASLATGVTGDVIVWHCVK